MKRICSLSGFAALLAVTQMGVAQVSTPMTTAAPVPTAVVPATCELHIWPAETVASITQGAGASFGLLGALIDSASHAEQNKRDKVAISAALSPANQNSAMKDVKVESLLNLLPPVNVSFHDNAPNLKGDEAHRLSDSKSQCYYELVVRELYYLKTATVHAKIRSFIAVRKFDGDKLVDDYRDSANHALEKSLPKEGEDFSAANADLLNAFKADVTEFSLKYARKHTKK